MLSSNEIAFQETTAANGVSLSPYYRETCTLRLSLYRTLWFLFYLYFFFFFSFFSIAGRRRAGQASRSAFIRKLNVEHSFFNERFAILISQINLVVSRHRELRVKSHRVCAGCARSSVYIYMYIIYLYMYKIYVCIYIYIFF